MTTKRHICVSNWDEPLTPDIASRMVELLQEFAYFPGRNEAEFYAIQEKARAILRAVKGE